MRVRLAVPTALAVAAALLAAPAGAASNRPQIRDPKGDVRGGITELDILTARWSTTGKGDSLRLVATMTLAGTPKKDVPFVYEMQSQVRGCGTLWFQYTPGTVFTHMDELGQPTISDGDMTASVWAACGGLVYKELEFTHKGDTISWSVPVALLPPQIEPGVVFSDFRAVADVGEPVMGHSVLALAEQSLDHGRGDGVWIMR